MNINNNFNLVKADENDLVRIKQILNSCQLPARDITARHLKHFYLLKNDTETLGSVGLEIYGNNGLLRSLATRECVRGKGFGKSLVKQIEKYAQEKNINSLYLLTTTAEIFFEKMGYSKISRGNIPEEVKSSKEFSSICPSSAVSMVKNL